MRILCYLVLLLTFGIASAQTATILQGDYISNVFGNSNFVLNPNAQTSNCTTSGTITCANVTVSSASITRSTTTPLVARTEFLMTTSTATGFADWALRTFDQGMKGQNCEARFTYKGFTVGTTTAQIHQGSNVVAQLTLTPSATDPRIASINFPCGDLSQVTKFRLQQATASLTGTNEIGGIYVGLATNMANVAQAEMVGTVTFSNGSAGKQGITSTWTEFDAGTWTPTVIGQGTGSNRLQIAFSYLPAGRYYVNAIINPVVYGGTTTSHGCRFGIQETTSGTVVAIKDNAATPANVYKTLFAPINGNFDFTTGAARTFRIVVNGDGYSQSASGNCFSEQTGDGAKVQLAVYRFPSSSELVVTPERQNVFAAARFTSVNTTVHSGGTAPTGYTIIASADFANNVTRFGRAQAPLSSGCSGGLSCSANDFGFSISNLPVGMYSVRVNGLLNATAGSNTTECSFQILEATTLASVAKQSHVDTLVSGLSTREFNASYAGVFNNTSVATRNFIVRGEKVGGSTTGNCQVNASATRDIYMELIPLDQPSNSALYVEGPVKAAATGAAIPSGFQGEASSTTETITSSVSSGAWRTGAGLTLQPGVYLIFARTSIAAVAPTDIVVGITDAPNTSPINDSLGFGITSGITDAGNTCCGLIGRAVGYFRVTTTKTFYPTGIVYSPVSSGYTFSQQISAVRLN